MEGLKYNIVIVENGKRVIYESTCESEILNTILSVDMFGEELVCEIRKSNDLSHDIEGTKEYYTA